MLKGRIQEEVPDERVRSPSQTLHTLFTLAQNPYTCVLQEHNTLVHCKEGYVLAISITPSVVTARAPALRCRCAQRR